MNADFEGYGRWSAAALAVTLVLGGCSDDPTGPGSPETEELGVVVNSVERTLTIFPVEDTEETETVDLAPDGSPVGLSVQGETAVVPLGTLNAAAIVDLQEGTREETVTLPEGSGATGSSFLPDGDAMVANPNLDTVSRIDVEQGTVEDEVQVGRFPHGILVHQGQAYVANAMLDEDFLPADEGTLTVLDADDLSEVGTVELSGLNPGPMAVGADGQIYVLNSGQFGGANGSLSIVDPADLEEVEHHGGFGDFPGNLAVGGDGRLYVGSFSYGLAVWDPETVSFTRGPGNAVEPGGVASVSGAAFDSRDRLHVVVPEVPSNGSGDGEDPGAVMRVDPADYTVEEEITAGLSAWNLEFTEVEER